MIIFTSWPRNWKGCSEPDSSAWPASGRRTHASRGLSGRGKESIRGRAKARDDYFWKVLDKPFAFCCIILTSLSYPSLFSTRLNWLR